MKKLSYKTLEEQNYDGFLLQNAPERMLQFGEGNFMRAFVDYFVDVMNETADFNCKVVVCQPIENGLSDMINEQEGLYTLFLRGYENGEQVCNKRVLSAISRCINPYKNYNDLMELAKNEQLRFISCNTTEAGIVFDVSCKFTDAPPKCFRAKLTQFLHARYKGTKNAKGFVILSCELIDNNGKELEKCVLQYCDLWNLGDEFKNWITAENIFCSTLVDRIVTGYPRQEASELCTELGYTDNLLNTAETFGFWVIEGPDKLNNELPFKKAGLPVIITADHTPYKQRKVRILNGAHTSMVLGAYLAGMRNVRDCMQNEAICNFMNTAIYDEIIPTLTLPKQELEEFANSVKDRFNNPFIDHKLLSISLNSTAKWKARVLPTIKAYVQKTGTIPNCLVSSFAYYIMFYNGHTLTENGLINTSNGEDYTVQDDRYVLEFFEENKDENIEDLAKKVCNNVQFWGEDLTEIPGFLQKVIEVIKNNDKLF